MHNSEIYYKETKRFQNMSGNDNFISCEVCLVSGGEFDDVIHLHSREIVQKCSKGLLGDIFSNHLELVQAELTHDDCP